MGLPPTFSVVATSKRMLRPFCARWSMSTSALTSPLKSSVTVAWSSGASMPPCRHTSGAACSRPGLRGRARGRGGGRARARARGRSRGRGRGRLRVRAKARARV